MLDNNIHRHMLKGVENFYASLLICTQTKLKGCSSQLTDCSSKFKQNQQHSAKSHVLKAKPQY